MGMDPVTVMAVVAVASKVGESLEQSASASSREQGLATQGKEMQLQAQQKTSANFNAMKKIISAQLAHQSVTGTTVGSPSFEAIQNETFAIGARNEANINTEEDITENNLRLEKDNVKSTLYAQLFSNASDLAMSGFNAYGKRPSTAKIPGAS